MKSQEAINEGLMEKLIAIHADVAEIKVQTEKTNGRVTGLELREAKREGQLTVIKWSLAAIVAPIVVAYILTLISG